MTFPPLKQQVAEIILNSPFKKWAKEYIDKLKPAIKIVRQQTSNFSLGDSRIGGEPDFPKEWVWPEYEGKPLEFLLQINIDELKALDEDNLLPESGWLYFFSSNNQWDLISPRVFYFDGDKTALEKKNSPLQALPGCDLQFELYYMLPQEDFSLDIDEFEEYFAENDLFESDSDDFYTLSSNLRAAIGQISDDGTHPHLLGYFESWQGEELPEGNQLLLELNTEETLFPEKFPAANVTWEGLLFYYISHQDLEQKKFENAHAEIEHD